MGTTAERALLACWACALAGLAAGAAGIVPGEAPLWGLAVVWCVHAALRAARLIPAR